MTPPPQTDRAAAKARYTLRSRVSSTAHRALLLEWGRNRWVWNQCVAQSRASYKAGEKCGPAMLGKTLTGWRAARTRLREGASVPQQQTVRDLAASRSKALKDVKDRLPVQRRAAKALKKVARQRQDTARKWARKVIRDHDAIAVEDLKPTFLAKTTMARKAADAAIGQAEQALVDLGREHGRDVRLVHPAYTSMHCGDCGARAKHRLPLSERVCTRTVCGVSRPRDKDSAHVVLVRAGLDPAGAEGVRPGRPQDVRAA